MDSLPPGTLAAGEFTLPSTPAGSGGGRGFHEVVRADHRLPATLPAGPGRRLVIRLRDLGRPAQACSGEHPSLSGCASVDWTDTPITPKTPPDGIHPNRLLTPFASGARLLYLAESLELADTPPPLEPT